MNAIESPRYENLWIQSYRKNRDRPKIKWIPVTEELPDDKRPVLLCFRTGEMMVGYLHRVIARYTPPLILPEEEGVKSRLYWTDAISGGWSSLLPYSDVVAWSELPAPFKYDFTNPEYNQFKYDSSKVHLGLEEDPSKYEV